MNKLMQFLARIAVGKQIVGALGWMHDKLDGKKSEVAAALLAIVHILKMTGTLPPEQAAAIESALLAILPVALADRASKVLKTIDGIAPKLPPKN